MSSNPTPEKPFHVGPVLIGDILVIADMRGLPTLVNLPRLKGAFTETYFKVNRKLTCLFFDDGTLVRTWLPKEPLDELIEKWKARQRFEGKAVPHGS